jgi:hypothetical protein
LLVAGERKAAITEGFRLLAAYIFGVNKPNVKIAMTSPVQQQLTQTIMMKALVTQKLAIWSLNNKIRDAAGLNTGKPASS